jgi:site-specific recombinase XerD
LTISTDGGSDLRTVRDNLGHVSPNTTSLYLHEEEDKRRRETVKRHRMNWDGQQSAQPDASETDQ